MQAENSMREISMSGLAKKIYAVLMVFCLLHSASIGATESRASSSSLTDVLNGYYSAVDTFLIDTKRDSNFERKRVEFDRLWLNRLVVAAASSDKSDPALSAVYQEISAMYLQFEDFDAVINACRLSVKSAKTPSDVLRSEAALANNVYLCYWLMSKRNDKKDLIEETFRNAISKFDGADKNYMRSLVDLLNSFGDFKSANGDLAEAIELYRKSAKMLMAGVESEHNPDIILLKAASLAGREKNTKLAVTILEKVLSLDKTTYSFGYYLHTVAHDIDSNHGPEYQDFVKSFVSSNPSIRADDPWLWVVKVNEGRYSFSKGKYLAAIKQLSEVLKVYDLGLPEGRPALNIGRDNLAEIVGMLSQAFRVLGDRDSAENIELKFRNLDESSQK